MSRRERRAQRRDDFLESNVQMAVGFVLGGIVTYLLFGLTVLETLGANSIFFIVSYVRQITIRSLFRARERRAFRSIS